MTQVLAGYEIGTGKPVQLPMAHMAVTGQTQRSGKTTAQEALVERSGMQAVVFLTKRGESAFQFGNKINPYFHERADWKFVKDMFEQLTGYSQNDKEAEVIRLCDGARSLEQVWSRVRRRLGVEDGAKKQRLSKRADDMYTRMDAYFGEIMPQLDQLPRSRTLDLKRGVNVIDLRPYVHSVQELLIQNALQWVYEKERNTIVIVPEAWDFLGEDHGSITRTAGREFIRRSAALGNFLWADCQDLRGLDKVIVGQMGVWLVGIQREMNEVARTIKSFTSIPAPPSPTELMTLGIGEFYVLHGSVSIKVYVQPVWANPHECALYAKERRRDGQPARPMPKMPPPPRHAIDPDPPPPPPKDPARLLYEERDDELDEGREVGSVEDDQPERARMPGRGETPDQEDENSDRYGIVGLRADVAALREEVARLARAMGDTAMAKNKNGNSVATSVPATVAGSAVRLDGDDREQLYQWFRDRIRRDPEMLAILASKPSITVTIERPTIEASGKTLRGGLAQLIAEKFFDTPQKGQAAFDELQRRGRSISKPNVYRECDSLAELGFLTKEEGGYHAVSGMKVRIVEA